MSDTVRQPIETETHQCSILVSVMIGFVLLTVLAKTEVVWAALWLEFDPPAAPPKASVEVQTLGEGAFAPHLRNQSYNTYLVSEVDAEIVASPDDTSLIWIGQLAVDEEGNGILRFVVPDILPGRYVCFIYCEECVEFSMGRVLLAVGEFQVTTPTHQLSVLQLGVSDKVSTLIYAFLFVLVAVVGGAYFF